MPDDPGSTDLPSGRPGLIRSIVHRLGGGGRRAPGRRTASVVRGRDGMAQLRSVDTGRSSRPGRARRLLDVHLRQLAAHAPLPPRLGSQVPRRRPDGDRRAHARVRLRGRHRQRHHAVEPPRCGVPDRGRQPLRRLARLREPILAGAVHRRRGRPNPVPSLRRGRVPDDRDGHPAVAGRRRRRRGRTGPGHGRTSRSGSGC